MRTGVGRLASSDTSSSLRGVSDGRVPAAGPGRRRSARSPRPSCAGRRPAAPARRAGATSGPTRSSSSQRSSGMPASANGLQTSSMKSFTNSFDDRARVPRDAFDHPRARASSVTPRWTTSSAAASSAGLVTSKLPSPSGTRMPSFVALATSLRRSSPLPSRRRSSSSAAATTSGVSGSSSAARLEREQPLAGVAEQALDAVELEAFVLQPADQLQALDVLAGRSSPCGRGPRAAGAARARGGSARCAR